jgi:hypothetical protein
MLDCSRWCLVLVNEHVVEAIADMGGQGRIGDHLGPVEQQVVVIEHALCLLRLHIAGKQLPQLHLPGRTPREMFLQHGFEGHLSVHGAGVDGKAGALGRKAALGLRETQLMPKEVHQVGRIPPVVDREVWLQANLLGIFAHQPGADRVERPGPGERIGHDAGPGAEHLGADALDPSAHLGRGPAGKGHQQDAAWIDAVDDQVGNPAGQGVGLARSRPGDDEQRRGHTASLTADAMFDGAPLLGIQCGEVVERHRSATGGQRGHHSTMILVLFTRVGKPPIGRTGWHRRCRMSIFIPAQHEQFAGNGANVHVSRVRQHPV